jgi:hypothetical protein
MNKTKFNRLYFLFTILLSVAYSHIFSPLTAIPKPSPYFVHDTEVYFWSLYNQTMQIDAPSKASANAIFTPHNYVADLFLDLAIGDWGFTTGYAFQASSEGHPDSSFPNSNDNLSSIVIVGSSYRTKNINFHFGYLFGSYAIDPYIYNSSKKDNVYKPKYFNYENKRFESGIGFDRLYANPDAQFHRGYLDFSLTHGEVIFHYLQVFGGGVRPTLTGPMVTFKLFKGKYEVSPYNFYTEDVTGRKNFGIGQWGAKQKYYFQKSRQFTSIFLMMDMNYSKIPETSVTPGRDDFFAEIGFSLYGFTPTVSYNNESSIGGGLQYLMHFDRPFFDFWVKFKYNPYISTPVYLRDVSDSSWDVEWGFIVGI